MIFETAIVLVLVFGMLVMIHELGHFVAARLAGIRVEEFAFGFGPKLLTLFKRGDTEYTIHPIPAGGFVKLAGMEPGQEDVPDGFQAQSTWKRALVILAGPVMSFVLAITAFLFVGVYWGFPDFTRPENRVGQVNPQTEAARIGLRAGDRILSVNGVRVGQGKDMTDYIHNRPGKPIKLVVQRNGRRSTRTGTPQWTMVYLGANWSFMRRDRAVVENVDEHTVAKRAGIEADDVLLSIDGRRILGGQEMAKAIESAGQREVTIELLRAGKHIAVRARPDIQWVRFAGAKWGFPGGIVESGNGNIQRDSTAGKVGVRIGDQIESIAGAKAVRTGEQMISAVREGANAKGGPVVLVTRPGIEKPVELKPTSADVSQVQAGQYSSFGLLGFMPAPALVPAGFGESIARGVDDFGKRVAYLITVITSKQIKEDIGGPVMIVRATASSVALGPYYVLEMLGMLSLSFSFINLVPIPVLDGGHLVILLVEAIRRKRLTPQQMSAVMAAGLVTIVALSFLVLYLDIFKITRGLVPQ